MIRKWKSISREEKFSNPWWKYIYEKVELPDGQEWEYHSVQTPGSVIVVPLMDDGRLFMLRQYRYLADDVLIEFPAGGIKEGEEPEVAAQRELIEETGHAGELQYLGKYMPWNGVTGEYCHAFIARNLRPSDKFHSETEEELEPHPISIADFEDKIKNNEITDGMSLSAWSLAKPHL